MLKVDGTAEKQWAIGHHSVSLTGRAFTDDLHVFAKGAQMQIDAMLQIDADMEHLELRPMLVEVTVRACTAEETAAYQSEQEQWLQSRARLNTLEGVDHGLA